MTSSLRYRPISDYALIGNRHSCALVSRDGSIDWCCLPHLESPSVFAALLDVRRGGRWRVAPTGARPASRAYLGTSPVLETLISGSAGTLRIRDFLPIRHGRPSEGSYSSHAIVRILKCVQGEVEVEMEWAPRPNYALDDVRLTRSDDAIGAIAASGTLWLAGLPSHLPVQLDAASARATLRLRAGEECHLISSWGEPPDRPTPILSRRYLTETLRWWSDWGDACCLEPAARQWHPMMLRSGMVLKLLTNERSGAMAAAPTTSLPEEIGGVRNWDYRFCWVRDASMTSRAFAALGQREEGIAFLRFLEGAAQQHGDPARVQVLYGLDGSTRHTEYTLGHLDGYRDSRPVRIGNAAGVQRQLDVYGELLQAAYELLRSGASIAPEQWHWLQGVANHVCRVWGLPDRGIWEVRGPERHFTYSKLMCWVALDRALRIADRLGARDVALWRRERDAIRAAILEQGIDARRNTFVQSFESSALDASNLLIPLVGFLPASDPRVQGTIDATLRELTVDGLVHRYHTSETADGVAGSEGAFGLCTFWLADALALGGRADEALDIFEGMLARANDVGLYSEEIDPVTGEFLGNFPQAFTHVGLINSAHFVGRALAQREAARTGAYPADRDDPAA